MKKQSTFARNSLLEGVKVAHTQTHAHEHVQESEKPLFTPKATKEHRVHMVMEKSTVMRLDACARKYGVSRSHIIQTLVEDFLRKEAGETNE